jgi:ABC-2 type transport system ATP-binding protein
VNRRRPAENDRTRDETGNVDSAERANDFMSNDRPVVILENLTKQYGTFTALADVSFALNAGEIFGLIGPNGAGKTTTIKILVGLIRPTRGRASIAGADCVRDARRIKRLVGYMPDQFGAFDNMRVWEYLDFFGAAFGIPRRLRNRRIAEILETTGTTYMKDRFVESLSHGMQQRVGVARTLLHDPQVLILDEPANGLDPQARIEMRNLLLALAKLGKTLIVTSHILPDLSRICDRVGILTHGRLRAFGTVDQISRQVSQRRTFEAHLTSAEHVAPVAALIRRALDPLAEVTEARDEEVVRFRAAISEAELGNLLAQLVQAGMPVTQFHEVQTDLEEAYMSFATGSDAPPATALAAQGAAHG